MIVHSTHQNQRIALKHPIAIFFVIPIAAASWRAIAAAASGSLAPASGNAAPTSGSTAATVATSGDLEMNFGHGLSILLAESS